LDSFKVGSPGALAGLHALCRRAAACTHPSLSPQQPAELAGLQRWAAGTGTNCLPKQQNKLPGPDDLNQIVLQEFKSEVVEQVTNHTTSYFSQMLLQETAW